ncbi:MAG: ABC transporter substrate-binding protein [Gemmataceae bacterium]
MLACRKLLVLPVMLGLLSGILALSVEARPDDPPGAKKRMEEEDDKPAKKPSGGKKRAEEEDDTPPAKPAPAKPAPNKGKRSEEEDEKPVRPGVGRLDEEADKQGETKKPAAVNSLANAAKKATHPRVKALYTDLAIPHDSVVMKRFNGVIVEGGKTGARLRVEPMADYYASPTDIKKSIEFQVIDSEGTPIRTESGGSGSISSIRYYEQIADDEVKDFLAQRFTGYDQANRLFLGRYDQLVIAEQVLAFVLQFHQSAVELGTRKGEGWETLDAELRSRLLGVLLEQVDQLAESRSWDAAFELTRRIVNTYTSVEDHRRIAGPVGELLRRALRDPSYGQDRLKEARTRLRFLEDRFPNSEIIRPISESLQAQAKLLFGRAKELANEKKMSEALEVLKQAEETWPELPGLRTYRMEMDRSYAILRVGMRELPRYLSPGWACTDAELRAVELLFESLVALTPDTQGTLYYRPLLAEGRPQVVPLGRQFKLPRHARWSDGRELTAGDLRFTVNLLRKGAIMGRSPAWGELLEDVIAGADPTRVKVRLKQGLLDPLGAMSFKLLPQRSTPDPTREEFALNPITSGPFVWGGTPSEPSSGRRFARFVANESYGVRGDRLGLPRIREVRFFISPDPAADLRDGKIDVALDLTAEQVLALQKENADLPLPTAKTLNRRIYFLAVNNRHPALANPDLRLALARAIPRETLLDQHYRKGLGRTVHKAINGPYPAGSWACAPALVSRADKTSLDPFDPDLARTKLRQGLTKLNLPELKLSLKYPSGDKLLEAALVDLCEQVSKTLPNVKLTPEARTPYELRREVEETHNYDLAYYHHDFVDETLWLYPLLGPAGRGGADNYLGYTGSLVSKVQAAMTLRTFSQVRDYAHAIHRQTLETDMPLIPLWQLDPLYALRRGAVDLPGPLDPLALFTQIEEWRVKPR